MSGQAFYSQCAAQCVQHFQQGFQAHRGLTGLQLHNEANAHASGQCQLGLGQPKLVVGSQNGRAQRFW